MKQPEYVAEIVEFAASAEQPGECPLYAKPAIRLDKVFAGLAYVCG
jgi:hypothetical protein